MTPDNNRVRYALFADISPDRDISFYIKCFFQQCKDFSCNKKIFRMESDAITVETVDHNRSAHSDKRRDLCDPTMPCWTDITGKLFPDI